MAIVGAAWSADLFGKLSAIGFIGSRLMDFTDAVGNGSQTHIVGKSFTTTDTGSVPGVGTGTGVGIVGIDPMLVSTTIFATALGLFGQFGARLQDCCDALGQNIVDQMALADLASNHTPVFAGAGVVDVGSIPVVDAGWGGDIETEGDGSGFIGSQWPNFALAIGTGFAAGVIAGGTGNVTISGSFGGSVPPGPVPGAGTGSGTIS